MMEKKQKVYSFDVFDTVLTRSVGSPESVFLLLGQKLYDKKMIRVPAAKFANDRIQADFDARKRTGKEEISLEDIYNELTFMIPISKEIKYKIIQEELIIEKDLIKPVPGIKSRLTTIWNNGNRVVFLSDMYLPYEFIKERLTYFNLMSHDDSLYVSSRHGKTKATGNLYSYVMEIGKNNSTEYIHTGDNRYSDYEKALESGWKPVLFKQCYLNRYERIMEANADHSYGFSSLLAGASRLTRLNIEAKNNYYRSLRNVTAGVAAPILTSYVIWVLLEASKKKLSRLYFVSRDGWILLKIARKLRLHLNIDIELRYLHGSRQAWHFPAMKDIGEHALEWVFHCNKVSSNDTIKSILDRLQLDPFEIKNNLKEAGIPLSALNRVMDESTEIALKNLFLQDKVRRLILSKATEKRKILLRYLDQEGLLKDNRYAIVDSGWTGRSFISLTKIMSEFTTEKPFGFYLGLFTREYEKPGETQIGYLKTGNIEKELPNISGEMARFLEAFCQASHGKAIDYTINNGGRVVPKLIPYRNKGALRWGLLYHQKVIYRFVDELTSNPYKLYPQVYNIRSMLINLLSEFTLKPTKREVECWGAAPFEEDQTDTKSALLAEPYQLRHIPSTLFSGKLPNNILWRSGGWINTPRKIRIMLKICIFMHYFMKNPKNYFRQIKRKTPL